RGGVAYKAGDKFTVPTKPDDPSSAYATFKWSRDNGSVVFPLVLDSRVTEWQPDGKSLTFSVPLQHLAKDARPTLKKDEWGEYVDTAPPVGPARAPTDMPRRFFRVADVTGSTQVTLKAATADKIKLPVLPEGLSRCAFLRRWEFTPTGHPLTDGKMLDKA